MWPPSMPETIQCPFCIEGENKRMMKARADGGWFLCTGCGHVTMPGHESYRCNCPKCGEASSRAKSAIRAQRANLPNVH